MAKIRYLSAIIHKLENLEIVKKEFESKISKIIEKNGILNHDIDNHMITMQVKFDPDKVDDDAPEKELSKKLYSSPFTIKICTHGFLLLETNNSYSFSHNDREHVSQSLAIIESKAKDNEKIRFPNQLLKTEDCEIKPDFDSRIVFNKSLDALVTTLLHGINKDVNKQLKKLLKGLAGLDPKNQHDEITHARFGFVHDVISLEKEYNAWFYKLLYGQERCDLINSDISEILEDVLSVAEECQEIKKQALEIEITSDRM